VITGLELQISQLEPLKYPLVNKFYDQFRVKGRAKGHDDVWVGYLGYQLIAACRIQHVAEHLFLSTLFVDPDPAYQGLGYGRRIIQAIQSSYQTNIYLFAHPDLSPFYASVGFAAVNTLPDELTKMLKIYQKHNLSLASFLSTYSH